MSPRMGVITTAVALTLSVVLGITLTSSNTMADVKIDNFTGTFNTTEEFTDQTVDSAACGLNNDAVSITFTDSESSEIGSITGQASLENCSTTVSGETSAIIEAK